MQTIQGLRVFLEDSDTEMFVYLIYMADRLWKMKDLLKPTGIVSPHCAPSANYHLRMLMDSVFGAKNFRNEIVWRYTGPSNTKKRWFPQKHDTILCYGKIRQTPKRLRTKFNPEAVRIPYSEDYVKQFAKQYNEGKDKSIIFAGGHDTERNQELARQGKTPEDWVNGHFSRWQNQRRVSRFLDAETVEVVGSHHSSKQSRRPYVCSLLRLRAPHSPLPISSRGKANPEDGSTSTSRSSPWSPSSNSDWKTADSKTSSSRGLPKDQVGNALLAKEYSFEFEVWAVESLNFGDIGRLPNKVQRCDTKREQHKPFASQNHRRKKPRPRAGKPSADKVKDFAQTIKTKKAAAGIFIAPDNRTPMNQ